MKVGDLVVATKDSWSYEYGDIGLLIAIDRGPPHKEYRPLYFVQWNNSPYSDPYEYEVNEKHIEVLYSP